MFNGLCKYKLLHFQILELNPRDAKIHAIYIYEIGTIKQCNKTYRDIQVKLRDGCNCGLL